MKTNRSRLKMAFLVFCLIFGLKQGKGQDRAKKSGKESETFVKKAEKAKKDGNFVIAEANYREALGKETANAAANYNLGHLYGDKQMDVDGMNQLFKTVKNSKDKSLRHKAFHNMGNAYMKQEDYAQAVKAYKDALRNDPTDDETRYNLAIAKKKLEDNPDQNDQSDDEDSDDQDQDDENSKENQDQQDQDQDNDDENDENDQGDDQDDENDPNQDKEDGEDEEDQSGGQDDEENEDQNEDSDNEQDQQGDQTPQGISDEQAENLLKAAENLEKGVQEKLNAKEGKEIEGKPNRKDW